MVATSATVLQRGIWDQASVRRQHMTSKGDDITSFVVLAERHSKAPQASGTFDTAASDLLSEQTRLNILCWNPRGSPGAIENHIATLWRCKNLQNISDTKTSLASSMVPSKVGHANQGQINNLSVPSQKRFLAPRHGGVPKVSKRVD